jgi:hypothetical protein
MHKESFIINRDTLLQVSTLLGHLQGELFCYRYTKVALFCGVSLGCCLFSFYGWVHLSAVPRVLFTPPKTTQYTVRTAESSRLQKQRSTQSTAHSHSTIKCNLSVTITKVLPEDDPAGSKHVGVCYDR